MPNRPPDRLKQTQIRHRCVAAGWHRRLLLHISKGYFQVFVYASIFSHTACSTKAVSPPALVLYCPNSRSNLSDLQQQSCPSTTTGRPVGTTPQAINMNNMRNMCACVTVDTHLSRGLYHNKVKPSARGPNIATPTCSTMVFTADGSCPSQLPPPSHRATRQLLLLLAGGRTAALR